jgi:hypothetical protein
VFPNIIEWKQSVSLVRGAALRKVLLPALDLGQENRVDHQARDGKPKEDDADYERNNLTPVKDNPAYAEKTPGDDTPSTVKDTIALVRRDAHDP